MAQPPLGQPPSQYDVKWIYQLWQRVVAAGGILWSGIDKKGSNLKDLETRNHSDLQNLNANNTNHLTDKQYSELTGGGDTALHSHSAAQLAGAVPPQQPVVVRTEEPEEPSTRVVITEASQLSVTPGWVGNSGNLEIALDNLDMSQKAQADTGFEAWTGAGNYYSITANQFTLLRGGSGYILGRRVTWNAGQVAAAFTVSSAHWIYIDQNGLIGITTSRSNALYSNNIILFEAYYDGTNYEVCFENHPISFDTDTMQWVHNNIGTIIAAIPGSLSIGANITRITTGTGGAITDRQLKMVGAADLDDQGLFSLIPDSAGAAIPFTFYYPNALGVWTEFAAASNTQIPMFYNNAGVMTALNTGGSGDIGVWTIYATKADPNVGATLYYAVPDSTAYNTDTQANTAINSGLTAIIGGQLAAALEPAQLGTVVVTNNPTGGYISTVNISKSTARAYQGGGGAANTANAITTDTSQFRGNLSAADTTVQQALDTLDNMLVLGIPGRPGEDGESGYRLLSEPSTATVSGISLATARAVATLRI